MNNSVCCLLKSDHAIYWNIFSRSLICKAFFTLFPKTHKISRSQQSATFSLGYGSNTLICVDLPHAAVFSSFELAYFTGILDWCVCDRCALMTRCVQNWYRASVGRSIINALDSQRCCYNRQLSLDGYLAIPVTNKLRQMFYLSRSLGYANQKL